MPKSKDAILDFYRNGGVERIIKKYSFSDEEKEILYKAQRTAKRDEPNMELIRRADNLLSIVAKVRKPIKAETIDPKEMADAILFAEEIDKKAQEFEETLSKKRKIVRAINFLLSLLLGYILTYMIMHMR